MNADPTFRYDMEVPVDGRLEVAVPLPAGSPVTVIVFPGPHDDLDELAAAAASSMDFWDNPYDDEDWNNA